MALALSATRWSYLVVKSSIKSVTPYVFPRPLRELASLFHEVRHLDARARFDLEVAFRRRYCYESKVNIYGSAYVQSLIAERLRESILAMGSFKQGATLQDDRPQNSLITLLRWYNRSVDRSGRITFDEAALRAGTASGASTGLIAQLAELSTDQISHCSEDIYSRWLSDIKWNLMQRAAIKVLRIFAQIGAAGAFGYVLMKGDLTIVKSYLQDYPRLMGLCELFELKLYRGRFIALSTLSLPITLLASGCRLLYLSTLRIHDLLQDFYSLQDWKGLIGVTQSALTQELPYLLSSALIFRYYDSARFGLLELLGLGFDRDSSTTLVASRIIMQEGGDTFAVPMLVKHTQHS